MSKSHAEKLGSRYYQLFRSAIVSNLGDGIALIAYPWLASAVTRSPILIALIAVMARLPWLLFSLPAGVITDRLDRKKLIISMDLIRGVVTIIIGLLVLLQQNQLVGLKDINVVKIETNYFLYSVLLIATFIAGCAEVLRDNSAQTVLPAIVEKPLLEKANGRLWSAEFVVNSFIGPLLGSFIIGLAIYLPFFINGGSFFIAAAMMAAIAGNFNAVREFDSETGGNWRRELKEGLSWLWQHNLLRPLAIYLGLMNALSAMAVATYILFAQEILQTSVLEFAILGTGAALGGIIGGVVAHRITKLIGPGTSLKLFMFGAAVLMIATGLVSNWVLVWIFSLLSTLLAVLWNVITVSLRQQIIPDQLLGRVNSTYRFFGLGLMPIGSLVGGGVIAFAELFGNREFALRLPFVLGGILHLILFLFARRILTNELIDNAKNIN
ncbi:MAG: MFS transporter [Actinobacteria bacterium]|nr:MFS transporter [Actinomycetota bacterium]